MKSLLLFLTILPLLLFMHCTTSEETKSIEPNEPQKGFPHQYSFRGCTKPSHVTQAQMNKTVSEFYFYWKEQYLTKSGSTEGGYYINTSGGTGASEGTVTVSEGHGFGMIIVALMAGDGELAEKEGRKIFDGLFIFFKAHPCESNEYLMSWEVIGDGKGGEQDTKSSSATDGDLDIAYALILAHNKWGSDGDINYLEEAKLLITKGIYGNEVGATTKRPLLGSWDSEENYQSRPSDWMTSHFHTFALVTGDNYWNEVSDTIYAMSKHLIDTYAPNTGLVSDFVIEKESKPAGENFLNEFKATNAYYNNACRVPLRIATDAVHYQEEFPKKWMIQITDWIDSTTNGNPDNIVGGYYLNGEEVRDKKFPAFTAPLVAASIVGGEHQEYLNKGWDIITTWRTNYYNDSINLLAQLLISGNWWKAE